MAKEYKALWVEPKTHKRVTKAKPKGTTIDNFINQLLDNDNKVSK